MFTPIFNLLYPYAENVIALTIRDQRHKELHSAQSDSVISNLDLFFVKDKDNILHNNMNVIDSRIVNFYSLVPTTHQDLFIAVKFLRQFFIPDAIPIIRITSLPRL